MLIAGLLACAFHVRAPVAASSLANLSDGSVSDGELLRLERHPRDRERLYLTSGGLRWLVDTGASLTTCDDDAMTARGFTVARSHVRTRGELGTVALGRAELGEITLGGWTFRALPCAVRDLATTSSVPKDPSMPVDGILGANVLRHFALEVDVRAGTARLRRARQTVGGARLRRERWGSPRKVVVLEAGGVRHRAVVDSGADRTYLPGTGGTLLRRSPGVRHGTGGAGRVVTVEERNGDVRLEGIPLGEATWIAREGTPLLGMDLLGERFVIDLRGGRLVVDDEHP